MRRVLVVFVTLLSLSAFAQQPRTKKPVLGYDMIHPYHKGLAKIEKDKKQGFINPQGEEVVPCKYDNIYPWEKGRAKVEIAGKYGYINEAGEEYIPVKYSYIGPFKNGLAVITNALGRRGLINEQGEEVVPLD